MKIDLCEYDKEGWPPAVRQEFNWDKFIFGLIDDNVKEWVLWETDVTLSNAVETAQQTQSSRKQIKEMGRLSVNMVQESEQSQKQHTQSIQCTQGGQHHKPKLLAFGKECLFCKKPHYFAYMCCSKQAMMRSKIPLAPQPNGSWVGEQKLSHTYHKQFTKDRNNHPNKSRGGTSKTLKTTKTVLWPTCKTTEELYWWH